MTLIKEIDAGDGVKFAIHLISGSYFLNSIGYYDNGEQWTNIYGRYETQRKAINALKKRCSACCIEYA